MGRGKGHEEGGVDFGRNFCFSDGRGEAPEAASFEGPHFVLMLKSDVL